MHGVYEEVFIQELWTYSSEMWCFKLVGDITDNGLVEKVSGWNCKIERDLSRVWKSHSRYSKRSGVADYPSQAEVKEKEIHDSLVKKQEIEK